MLARCSTGRSAAAAARTEGCAPGAQLFAAFSSRISHRCQPRGSPEPGADVRPPTKTSHSPKRAGGNRGNSEEAGRDLSPPAPQLAAPPRACATGAAPRRAPSLPLPPARAGPRSPGVLRAHSLTSPQPGARRHWSWRFGLRPLQRPGAGGQAGGHVKGRGRQGTARRDRRRPTVPPGPPRRRRVAARGPLPLPLGPFPSPALCAEAPPPPPRSSQRPRLLPGLC